jgi:hypothetical protein
MQPVRQRRSAKSVPLLVLLLRGKSFVSPRERNIILAARDEEPGTNSFEILMTANLLANKKL